MPRFSFPKQARLRREREYEHVYQSGRRLRAYPLRACALRRGHGRSRLGLSISRRVGGSVVRNRWKRAVREAFRLNRHRLRAAYDIVVSVSYEAPADEAGRTDAALNELIDRLNQSEGSAEAENGSS